VGHYGPATGSDQGGERVMQCHLCGKPLDPLNRVRVEGMFVRHDHYKQYFFCNWPCLRKYAERATTNVADVGNRVGIFDPEYMAELEATGAYEED